MPINELEQHPYLNYHEEFQSQTNKNYYKGIIIGSFPIYAVTNSINPKTEVVINERFNEEEASMRFFYGSRDSSLWEYLSACLNLPNPRKNDVGDFLDSNIAGMNCKNLLHTNELLMSDSLYRTNRKELESEDKNLLVRSQVTEINDKISYNRFLFDQLKENVAVRNIYFTSTVINGKSPFGWFKSIFQNQITIYPTFSIGPRQWSGLISINFGNGNIRKYSVFFLPTPKPRGIHWKKQRVLMFGNFMSVRNPEFFQRINPMDSKNYDRNIKNTLKGLRLEFITECYRQAILYNNLIYEGSNPINA